MASNVRSDITDQDILTAREKEADEQYERQLLQEATNNTFWDSLISTGVITNKDRSALMDWITLFTEKHDSRDFFEEAGDRFASALVKLVTLYQSPASTQQVDFALVVMDNICRTSPQYLSLFRAIAKTSYEAALSTPEVQAFQKELQRQLADAQAQAAAAAAELEITGKVAELTVLSVPHSPTPAQQEDLSRYGGLYDGGVFGGFLGIINNEKSSGFQLRKAYKVLAALVVEDVPVSHVIHRHVFRVLIKAVSNATGFTQLAALAGMKTVLKNKELHYAFRTEEGMHALSSLLKKETKHMQPLYLAGFCVWLLTFNSDNDTLIHGYSIVGKTVSIIRAVAREKVVRICFSILVNLLGRSTFTEEMIGADLHRALPALAGRKWKDEDILVDLEKVKEVISARIHELSSFEMYKAELMSGALRKSPVHNEKFWRDNAIKFEDNNYVLIKTLIAQLSSDKEDALEMACYDLGEFARFHPDGKKILNKLDAKTKLMALMSNQDINIAKAALLAVQKLLIHKWDTMLTSAKK